MMKYSSIQPPSLSPGEATRRLTAIRITLVTGLLLFSVALPTLVTTPPDRSPNYIGNVITLVMSLIALACSWIAYRYDYTRGILIFTGTLLLFSLGIPFYANGLGLQSGIIVTIIVVSIASTTLSGKLAASVSIAAVIVETMVILADLYLPDFGIEKLESSYITPFLIVIILIFAYYVFRRYESYTFRAKLIISFVAVAFLAIGALAIGVNTIGRRELSKQVGLNVSDLADTLASTIGTDLGSEISLLQAAGSQFEEAASEASRLSVNKTEAEIFDQLLILDAEWSSAGADSPLIRGVIQNEMAGELLEFREFSPQHVELSITDRYGANLAATNRTSDYYQADEDWWQAAYNEGTGAIYISQPELDESVNAYTVVMALPLYQDGEVVGILQSTLDVTYLTELLGEARVTEVGHADLIIGSGELLGEGDLTIEDIAGLSQLAIPFGDIDLDQTPNFASKQNVSLPLDNPARDAVANLGWSVVVHQSIDQALLPVEDQTRATTAISMGVLLGAALLGLLASQRAAAPLVRLTSVTGQIEQGDLDIRADIQTQDEFGALSSSFNRMADQLQETLRSLELRVTERTADLDTARLQSEERARDLQSISEISRIITSEQRLDTLLPLITRLVSEKFNFYHSGIFLVDDSRLFAVLQASNSEGGRRMLNRGHRLELGIGIVGTVALTGKPRIALDVGADAVFFNNPDLPATRSEMALPLKIRGETIGVLDVQSTRAGEFTDDYANILGILADQIAITIENARLFARTQQALEEVQALYNQYLQKEWKSLQGSIQNVGYWQTLSGGKPIEVPVESDDIHHALQTGQMLILKTNGTNTDPAIIAPIKLRGQTIGVLNIRAAARDRVWSRDELNLVQSVTDRLALALENARLFEDTSRRAERERLVSEITGKIRSVNDPQVMIQTALEELRNALGASRVQVIPQTLPDTEKTNE
ncbi:MAG TPA: GAF domain-containing protein [Anaerolineales bacterium]|nr:GAF domain-containing protein [Anaerolineales bacterium]